MLTRLSEWRQRELLLRPQPRLAPPLTGAFSPLCVVTAAPRPRPSRSGKLEAPSFSTLRGSERLAAKDTKVLRPGSEVDSPLTAADRTLWFAAFVRREE